MIQWTNHKKKCHAIGPKRPNPLYFFWPFVYNSTSYIANVATIQSIFGRGRENVDSDWIPGFPVGVTGDAGERPPGRRNHASRPRIVFHSDVHCF